MAAPTIAHAQDQDGAQQWRVAIGPQLVPSYPGADHDSIRPFGNVARARGDAPLDTRAPDGQIGPDLLRIGGLTAGPSLNFVGARSRSDTDGRLERVGATFELGGFATYHLLPALWLSGAVRHGIGGHKGWVGAVGADYVRRDADRWLVAVGPRLTFADARFNRSYFGVKTAGAASGLSAYDPGGGLESVGANLGVTRRIAGPWGVYAYARYDRLVGDPGASPVVRDFGSRDQLSGGLALSYTFGRGRR